MLAHANCGFAEAAIANPVESDLNRLIRHQRK
jgi:hypothetical protein